MTRKAFTLLLGTILSLAVFPVKAQVTDIDGNTYNTVTIGTQVWMKENLKTTRYANGENIDLITDNASWAALTSSAYCWYNNDYATYGSTYGALYNWYAVSDSRNVCPTGWHVPSDAEWTELTNYAGGESVAGGKLKEVGTTHWWDPNTEATDEYGFSALPGGLRIHTDGGFYDVGGYGNWWSSTEYDATEAWYRHMYYDYGIVDRYSNNKRLGLSIRCIKNDENYGLVAYYPFTGNEYDESGNNNHPTATSALFSVSDRFENVNSAYLFNGTSSYIEIPSSVSTEFTGEVTVSAWVNPSRVDISQQAISSKGGGWSRAGWLLTLNNNKIRWHMGDGTSESNFDTETAIPSNTWTHIVAQWKDGTMNVYINGVKDNMSAYWASGLVTNTYNHYIGKTDATEFYFNGTIDDIRVYNRALSQTEVRELYHEDGWETIADIDGNVYNITTIGTQKWMAENLKTTRYANGEYIDNITDDATWAGLTTGAYCWYNNDQATYGTTNGALYNWYAASDTRNICPSGWHVPKDSEWYTMENFVDPTINDPNALEWRGTDGGTKLKSTTLWSNDGNGTNDYGFTAYPGGYRKNDGTWWFEGEYGYWWCNNQYDENYSWTRSLYYGYSTINRNSNSKVSGFSIRCLKNDINTGLVAYYPLNGNATDMSGYGNNGTSASYMFAPDRFNNNDLAFYFNGTNPVEVPSNSMLEFQSNDFTFDFWFTLDDIDRAHNGLMGRNDYEGISIEYNHDSNRKLRIFIDSDGYSSWDFDWQPSFDGWKNNKWYNLTLKRDQGTLSLYIDGAFVESTSIGIYVNNPASPLYIGRSQLTGREHLGKMDDVRIYNRALTETEIFLLYANYNPPQTLVAIPSDGQITLKWSSENISNISKYHIYQDGAYLASVNVSTAYDTVYTVNTLTNYQVYSFYVTSEDIYGNVSQPSLSVYKAPSATTVTDIEGNVYPTTVIGAQEWMAENLKTLHYSDGVAINYVSDNSQWSTTSNGSYCWYNNDYSTYGNLYGALYNRYAVNTWGNICPTDWHVPTDAEWYQLENFVDASINNPNSTGWRGTDGGTKLKSASGWYSEGNGTNNYGFTATPSGFRFNTASFSDVSITTILWSSSNYDASTSWGHSFYYNVNGIGRNVYENQYGFSIRCVRAIDVIPIVTTSIPWDITTTWASLGGQVTNDGGDAVIESGIFYGTQSNPSQTGTKVAIGSGVNSYSTTITSLTPTTTYYVQAYAINGVGIGYGEVKSFKTYSGLVSDYEGNTYYTIIIGTQEWMAENLKAVQFSNGENITNIIDNATWAGLTSPAYCWYDNNMASYKETYGALYNWYAVADTRNICPTGWHVPDNAEWNTLTDYLGGSSVAGGKLKTIGTIEGGDGLWYSPNSGATNETNFTAYPGGWRNYSGGFELKGYNGIWWSASNVDDNEAYNRSLFYDSENFEFNYYAHYWLGYSVRCISDAAVTTVPVLTTTAISNITSNSATGGGNVTSDGGATVVTRGIVWSNSYQNPTVELCEGYTLNGSGTGDFTSSLTGLNPNTTYYVRAYASNSVGNGYGEQVQFTTLSAGSTVTDIEGNVYPIVTIGTQVWMAKNLRTTKYSNGEYIDNLTDNSYWANATAGAYCWYNNDFSSYGDPHGALYNWYAVDDARNICPTGWHVPSKDEWGTLVNYVGGESVAGTKLKATIGWASSGNGTDDYGFSALPSGRRTSVGEFYDMGNYGYWWNVTDYDASSSWFIFMSWDWTATSTGSSGNNFGYSVRCIQGALPIPTVETTSVSNITSSTATINSNVTNDNGIAVTARGVVYSKSYQNPTIEANEGSTSDGSGTGEFTSSLSGLAPNTTYYVRAYATNSTGTGYGNQLSFITNQEGKFWVTFSLNMAKAFFDDGGVTGYFNPANHRVFISGNFSNDTGNEEYWPEPGSLTKFELLPVETAKMTDGSKADSLTFSLTLEVNEGDLMYKYFVIKDVATWAYSEWGGEPNRLININQNIVQNDGWGLFYTDKLVANQAESITFTNPPFYGTSDWHWNFGDGASVADAYTAGPHTISYSTMGNKSVSLSFIYNGSLTQSLYRENYITIGKNPDVNSIAESNIEVNSASVTCIVNPNWLETTVKLEYGTNESSLSDSIEAPTTYFGDINHSIQFDFTDLIENTTYYYRIVAENVLGQTISTVGDFSTLCSYTVTVSDPSGSLNVCAGETESYSTTSENAESYTWELLPANAGTFSSTNSSVDIVWSESFSGSAQIRVKGISGLCSNAWSSWINITVNSIASDITISGESIVCAGSEVLYSLSRNATSYEWLVSGGGGVVVNSTNRGAIVKWNSSGTGTVKIVEPGTGGCPRISTLSSTINTNSVPPKPEIHRKGPINILICKTPSVSYKWFYNNQLIAGETKQYYIARNNLGTYNVQIIGNQCPNTSNIYALSSYASVQPTLNVYPNPSSGDFTIEVESESLGQALLTITSSFGNIIHRQELNKNELLLQKDISLKNLPQGVYVITLQVENELPLNAKFTIY